MLLETTLNLKPLIQFVDQNMKKEFKFFQGTLTSSSSGHSSDDKWYDILQELEVPSKNGQQHTSRSSHTNTFPSTPKRNNNSHQISQVQVGQNHNHYSTIQPQPAHHNKIQVSNSLPLQHFSYSQPLTFPNSSTDDLAYKLEKNNLIKQQNDRLRQETEYHRSSKDLQHLSNDFQRLNIPPADTHSTNSSISDRMNFVGVGSEDDLSTGSGGGNSSPKSTRRLNKQHLPTGNSNYSTSRNQSPRSINGEAKLRPGVTVRSSNRNSANLSSNNAFQEELLRLINPDNIEAGTGGESKLSKDHCKAHSKENLNNTLLVHKGSQPPEVILTMARPATVISNASTASSPLPTEYKLSKEDIAVGSMLLGKGKNNQLSAGFQDEFPLPQDGDWPSLVDTATRVINSVGVSSDDRQPLVDSRRHWEDDQHVDASIASS